MRSYKVFYVAIAIFYKINNRDGVLSQKMCWRAPTSLQKIHGRKDAGSIICCHWKIWCCVDECDLFLAQCARRNLHTKWETSVANR